MNYEIATLKELRRRSPLQTLATPSELRPHIVYFTQGFKANPGLELANAFSVNEFPTSYSPQTS